MIHDPTKITSFGCGCNKGRGAAAATPQSRRVTVYQVMTDGNVTDEYSSLPEARKAALAAGGRVKVTSKVV